MDEIKETAKSSTIPFFLRIIAILILVTGTIGTLFYLFAAGFQLTTQNFFDIAEYKGYSGLSYYMILSIQILLNGGLVLSGILLLKLKKSGIFVFATSYVVLALLNYILQDDFGWTVPVIGLITLLIILLFKNRLS